MEQGVEVIRGETPGVEWRLDVLRFKGNHASAPSAYLQAALHGNELPGVAALHVLIPRLLEAERQGRLRGDVTVVPFANPIAGSQHLFGEHAGRFALGSRTNFNRDFPLLAHPHDLSPLFHDDAPVPAEIRLKARLIRLALGHDLVLDLHCDDEGLSYFYVADALWPHLYDLAAALRSEAVLMWRDTSDGAFEEAALHPYLGLAPELANWPGRAVATVEFRGRADVDPELARGDAEGLYRFLTARGTIEDPSCPALPRWQGQVTPLEHVEMMYAPAAGALLYHVKPGDRVKEGDLLVTILTKPGLPDGFTEVRAPQGGLILTRRAHRFTRLGDDLLKLLGSRPSPHAKSGTLDA